MMTYIGIIILIETIVIFFHGFYFGRRHTQMLLVTSLILLLSSLVSIILHGVYTIDFKIYEAIIVIIYIFFWWGLGYYISVELNLYEKKQILENL